MTRIRAQLNELQGSLISGTFRVAMPYVGVSGDHVHVSGMALSSFHSVIPVKLFSFAKKYGLGPTTPILYSTRSIGSSSAWTLVPQKWCFVRILVNRDHPLLEKFGAVDGTLPALFIDGDIKVESPLL